MGPQQPAPTRAAIRFSHFVRQLTERGVDQQQLAAAIGRSTSLVSKMKRLESAGRNGLKDVTIQGIVDAFNLSADFLFLSDEQLAKRFGDRAKVVEMPDGTTRPAQPGEVDAQLFSLDARREVATERRVVALEKQVAELTAALTRLTALLTPPQARGGK